jgi:nitrite reductase/ring-hydroxylating ferredoxin subunit
VSERHVLCRLADVPDGGSRGFIVGEGTGAEEMFIVRRGGQVFVYRNSCPHTGASLDWQPDVFLDPERRYIQCATHGALFRIEVGYCLHGPCLGSHLSPVPTVVTDGIVYRAG